MLISPLMLSLALLAAAPSSAPSDDPLKDSAFQMGVGIHYAPSIDRTHPSEDFGLKLYSYPRLTIPCRYNDLSFELGVSNSTLVTKANREADRSDGAYSNRGHIWDLSFGYPLSTSPHSTTRLTTSLGLHNARLSSDWVEYDNRGEEAAWVQSERTVSSVLVEAGLRYEYFLFPSISLGLEATYAYDKRYEDQTEITRQETNGNGSDTATISTEQALLSDNAGLRLRAGVRWYFF